MSIVNDALKKASGKSKDRDALTENKLVFSERTRGGRNLVLIGLSVFVLIGIVFLFWRINIKIKSEPATPYVAAPSVKTVAKKAEEVKKPDNSSDADIEKKASERHRRAMELYKEGKLAEAMAELLIVISLKPDLASAHNDLGLIYKESGMYDKADKEYQEALRIEPGYVGAINNLAVLFDNRGRYTEAAGLFKKAIGIDPKNPVANLNYAITLERMGNIKDAIRHYEIYLSHMPKGDRELGERIKKHLNNLQVR